MTWCQPNYALQDSRAFVSSRDDQWKDGKEYSFVIYSLKDDELLGSVGLSRLDHAHGCANVGYWVRHTRTRQGIASAAVQLIATFAFRELGLNRLELLVPLGNHPSMRVAEKAGALKEGVLNKKLKLQGIPCDAVSYAILAPGFHPSFEVATTCAAVSVQPRNRLSHPS
jgi:RimJ/RimL family protein N-acetyltransferase